MARKTRPPRRPVTVPLSPAVLHEIGGLTSLPAPDPAFDPAGAWTQSYRIWTCYGYTSGGNRDVGSLLIEQGAANPSHLVSHLDLLPTLCDYAGIAPPQGMHGRSLRPLLEGARAPWHPYIVAEVSNNDGRMVRTPRYKYVTYRDDPVEQLFDRSSDPGETKNLAGSPEHAAALGDHRKMLREWESRIEPAPGCPNPNTWRST